MRGSAVAWTAQKHLTVATDAVGPLTLAGVQEFVDRAVGAGIPLTATLSQPSGDLLRRFPVTFEVVWSEEL
jgi:hypothetical protein